MGRWANIRMRIWTTDFRCLASEGSWEKKEKRNIHICVCIYIYICICVCMHVCMYVYTYIHIYIHAYIHVYVHIHIHTHIMDSLRGSSVKIGTIQRRLAWPLRKDDTHKISFYIHAHVIVSTPIPAGLVSRAGSVRAKYPSQTTFPHVLRKASPLGFRV